MITANPVLANGIAGLATSATAQATIQVRHATAAHRLTTTPSPEEAPSSPILNASSALPAEHKL